MKQSTFNSDLQWGNYFETATIPFIETYFNKVLKPKQKYLKAYKFNDSSTVANLKMWDVKYEVVDLFTGKRLKHITFEIKADKYDSSNVFFEKKCNHKLSGVFNTSADYFVYVLPKYDSNNFYLAKPSDLSEFLELNYATHLTYGGDGNRALGYLINKNEFDEHYLTTNNKLLSYQCTIPDYFNVQKFEPVKSSAPNLKRHMERYDDDLDF